MLYETRIYGSWKLEIETHTQKNETPSIQQRQKWAMDWNLTAQTSLRSGTEMSQCWKVFSKDVFLMRFESTPTSPTLLPPGSLSSSFPSEYLDPYLALSLVTLLPGILAGFFLAVSLAASLAASLVDSLAASLTPSLSYSMVSFMAPSMGSSLIHSLLSSPPSALSTSASIFCIIAIIFYIFKLGAILRNKRLPLVRKG